MTAIETTTHEEAMEKNMQLMMEEIEKSKFKDKIKEHKGKDGNTESETIIEALDKINQSLIRIEQNLRR